MSLRSSVLTSLRQRSLEGPLLEVRELRRRGERPPLALLRKLDAGLDALGSEHPALEIARGVGKLLASYREDAARFGTGRDEIALARRLHAAVVDLWVPDLDEERLVRALYDEHALASLCDEHVPEVREDPLLGVAPISAAALAPLVARAFAPVHGVLSLDVIAAREALGRTDREDLRWHLARALEELFGAQERALGAYPPLRIRLALRPFLCALPLIQTYGVEFAADGAPREVATPLRSHLLGVALVQLRDAFEALIPGVLPLLACTPTDADALELGAAGGLEGKSSTSLFREAAEVREGPASLGDRLVVLWERLLFHASMLGTLSVWSRVARSKVSVLDRLNPLASTEEEHVEVGLRARVQWHEKALADLSARALGLEAVAPPLEVLRHTLLQEVWLVAHRLESVLVYQQGQPVRATIPALPALHGALNALARFRTTDSPDDPVEEVLRAGWFVQASTERRAGIVPRLIGQTELVEAIAALAAAWSHGPGQMLSAHAWVERELTKRLA
jgi:hypothetical protein